MVVMRAFGVTACFLFFVFVAGGVSAVMAEEKLNGYEIVQPCDYQNPGTDQRSKLTITLVDKDGNKRKNVYLRLWKDFKGVKNIADKMVLITEFPPDARGTGFMRWAFTPDAEKNADQWIYLPVLRKIRRVSIRDPGDSFLGSDLTYADISGRQIDQDEHTLVKVDKKNGKEFYVVESVPQEPNPLYSKRISWFSKGDNLDSCVKVGIIYHDSKGDELKKQSLSWQKIDDAWLWKKVEVKNVQTNHSSIFTVNDAEVNVGLRDNIFSERTLRKGYRR